MHHQILAAANVLATTATTSKHFHLGTWMITPLIILAVIIAIPVAMIIARSRRKRQQLASENEWPTVGRR
jgi:hypothetical protein